LSRAVVLPLAVWLFAFGCLLMLASAVIHLLNVLVRVRVSCVRFFHDLLMVIAAFLAAVFVFCIGI
jgi:hypothetical protein